MKKAKILFSAFLILFLGSCINITDVFNYKDTTKEFVESMLHKDYDKCIRLMAFNNDAAKNADTETIKTQLDQFREVIVQNFGDKLDYTFASAQKKWTTGKGESTPPNTTKVLVQFNNEKEFGLLQVYFDDTSKKIKSIKPLDVKMPIPKMTMFWLFGIIAICIPIFNVYMILRVKKSQYKKKWKKYLTILIFIVPAISYYAVSGFSFSLLDFQLLLGISFEFTGYLNTSWTVGIPLGGIYVLWQLRNGKDIPVEEVPVVENPSTMDNEGNLSNKENSSL